MVIHNHLFDNYRIKKKKIDKAINLLEANGYRVYKIKKIDNK